MRHFRFHIGTLVILILVLGVGFAALRESSDLWDSNIFTVTLAVLLIAILLTVHRMESRRAFWIGFAMFGWIYLGLTLVPSIESRLITTKLLTYLDSKVPVQPMGIYDVQITRPGSAGSANNSFQLSTSIKAGDRITIYNRNRAQVMYLDAMTGRLLGRWSGTTENFVRIGHSLFALLVGWLGGQLSRRLYRASRRPEVSTSVEAGGDPR